MQNEHSLGKSHLCGVCHYHSKFGEFIMFKQEIKLHKFRYGCKNRGLPRLKQSVCYPCYVLFILYDCEICDFFNIDFPIVSKVVRLEKNGISLSYFEYMGCIASL